jgi:PTS system fructose-specific IIC component
MIKDLDFKGKFKDSYKHFSSGVAAMLPFIMIGAFGQMLAILFAGGSNGVITANPILSALKLTGQTAMGIFVAVMAGFISRAIGGPLALAPGFIAGMLAVTGGAGYLGGLLGAFLAGYLTYVIVQVGKDIKVELKSTYMNLVPALGGVLVGVFILLVVNPPLQVLMVNLIEFLKNLSLKSRLLFGVIVGAIPGIDYGGPLSQAKMQTLLALQSEGLFHTAGVATGHVAVPPIGMCLGVLLAPHLYRKEIREYGRTGIINAIIGGWTEIAIPFVLDDPVRTMVPSIIGGMVCAVSSTLLNLQQIANAPLMGILYCLTLNKPWGWFVSVSVGSLTVALISNFMRAQHLKKHPLEEDEK